MKDDLELWEEFRLGIESSFKSLFDSYYQQLFNYGHKFCVEDEVLEDSVQELFIKLWKNRERLNSTPSVKNYLFKAFRRVLFRKLAEQHRFSGIKAEFPFEIELAHDYTMISEERMRSLRAQLSRALEKMSPRQREIIHLKFFEDMSYEEIARVMNLSPKSTYKLLYRAIDSLKEHMSPINLLILLSLLKNMSN